MPLTRVSDGRSGPATAAGVDAYLVIEGKKQGRIKGESHTPGHEDEVIVSGWRWGVQQSGSHGNQAATGRRVYQSLVIEKSLDRSSTSLMAALATNEELKKVKLSLRKAGTDGDDFFSIQVEQARLAGLDIVAGQDGTLIETLQIAFRKVEVTYHVQAASGIRGGSSVFTDELMGAV